MKNFFKNFKIQKIELTNKKTLTLIISVVAVSMISIYYLNQDVEIINFDNENNIIIMNNNYDIKFSTNLSNLDLNNFEITSSNEEIAKVEDNTIIPLNEGLVEITITYQNGIEATKEYEVKYIEVESLEILNEQLLYIDEEYSLQIETTPNQTSDNIYTYLSSNENVITINEDGTINVKELGSTTITVSSTSGVESSIDFIVEPKIAEIIVDNEEVLKLKNGRNTSLEIQILPSDDYLKYLTIQSSDEDVIIIDNTTIKSIGVGTANIIITSSNGLEQIIEVEVYEEAYLIEYNQLGEVGILEEYESKESIFYYLPEGKYQIELIEKNGYLCSLSVNYNKKIELDESYTYELKEKLNFYNVNTLEYTIISDTFILNTNDCNYKLTKLD